MRPLESKAILERAAGLRAGLEFHAAEIIPGGIGSAIRRWRQRYRGHSEEGSEDGHRIRDVQTSIVVAITGVRTTEWIGPSSPRKEMTQEVDGIRNIFAAIVVAIATHEKGGGAERSLVSSLIHHHAPDARIPIDVSFPGERNELGVPGVDTG